MTKTPLLLAEKIVARLTERGLWLAAAESCTGGLIAATITEIAGSSACFGYGVVSYSNQAKEQLLLVPKPILQEYGAVSTETASAMATGALRLSGADLALSVTGIAGPSGATPTKPVGLVYLALATHCRGEPYSPASTNQDVLVECHQFFGTRQQIRAQTVEAGLQMIWEYVKRL